MSTNGRSIIAKTLLLAAAGGLCMQAALAGDCAPIIKAVGATARAPGIRQYLALPGQNERLMSVTAGDSVYLAMGPAHWSKMHRKETRRIAKKAESDNAYRDCKSLGSDSVNGAALAVYQYSEDIEGETAGRVKIWIGADGLLRKQEVRDGAFMHYEYDHVKAPVL